MGDEKKPETTEQPVAPVVERIGDDMMDRFVKVQVAGKEVDMPLRDVLQRAGASENVAEMERDLLAQRSRFSQEARLGRQVASLIRDGRHADAEALVRQMAGVSDDGSGGESDDDTPVSPKVLRELRELRELTASLQKRTNAKDMEARLDSLLSKQTLFKKVPAAAARAKQEILAELMLNENADLETVVRQVHTDHVRTLEQLTNYQAEERRATEKETRTVAGAGGSPEIVPQMDRPTLADLRDKTKKAKLVDGLKDLAARFARANDPQV